MALPREPDCYWVEPDRLLAGEYPGSSVESTARAKLSGFRTVPDGMVRVQDLKMN